MDKKELREKFDAWVKLDHDSEIHDDILKLGQEKYNAERNFHKVKARILNDYFVDENSKIYFSDNDDNQELRITIDELFSDTQEWIKKYEKDYIKAREERERKEKEAEKEADKRREESHYKLYLKLKEKYEKAPVA